MSDAETLRRAAALMRERAEAATPGPWSCDDKSGIDDLHFGHVGIPVLRGPNTYGPKLADATHIASWHPAVALAVADLLDEIALRWEYVEERELALAVAHAYLQESP